MFLNGGQVQVSACGDGSGVETCTVSSGSTNTASVSCFGETGACADGMFSVSFLHRTPFPSLARRPC